MQTPINFSINDELSFLYISFFLNLQMKRHNAEVAPLQVASGVKSIPDVKGQVPSHGRGGGVLDSKTSLQREASPTTQIHAAAVNGQKTALQKLLKS